MLKLPNQNNTKFSVFLCCGATGIEKANGTNSLEVLFYNLQWQGENSFRLIRNIWFVTEVKWSETKSLSRVQLFATPWTVAYRAPPSMGFSRQRYWSRLPFPSPHTYIGMYKYILYLAAILSLTSSNVSLSQLSSLYDIHIFGAYFWWTMLIVPNPDLEILL